MTDDISVAGSGRMPEHMKMPITEKPILFSSAMIRAILENRKSVTRRVIKPQPDDDGLWNHSLHPMALDDDREGWWGQTLDGESRQWKCPLGEVGSRLWVREGMRFNERNNTWIYTADESLVTLDENDKGKMLVWLQHKQTNHCPSFHMPRWASRITLELTDVRVERLNNITLEAAIAEGTPDSCSYYCSEDVGHIHSHVVRQFQDMWDSLNAKRGFGTENNPWVWVLEFKRIEP